MRLGRFESEGANHPWLGATVGDAVVDLREAGEGAGVSLPRTMESLLATWNWREKAEIAVSYARETGTGLHDSSAVDVRAPVGNPRKIVAVGLNYSEHAEEGEHDVPDSPVLFSKFPQCLIGPEETVAWNPELTDAVDYECELVAVVGERARNVSEADALDHVAGFTVGNDVSARDLQRDDEQWVRGKSLDTFGPLGPHLVTTDEVGDPQTLDVWTEVNGDRLQDSNTRHMVFGVAELVSFCSHAFTLEPGDLLFTGTPDGVGYYRDPQVLLEDGDTVTVGVEGVGELTNSCAERAADDPQP